MIEVLVFGQPFWSNEIARAINRRGRDFSARHVPPRDYLGALRRDSIKEPVVIMRAGYRPGAPTSRGRLFDRYWAALRAAKPAALACYYWLGSDVLDTSEDQRHGRLLVDRFDASRADLHLADAPWLTAELAELGLEAFTAHLPQPITAPERVSELPHEFTVLTYIPGDRFAFYGGEVTLELATRFPDVRFEIVGRQVGEPRVASPNVRFLGWVADMSERLEAATAVLRIPRHDGLGQTIIEGLVHARHAIYTYPVPHVYQVEANVLSIAPVLETLVDAHSTGNLEANIAGRQYALQAFDESTLTERMVQLIKERM